MNLWQAVRREAFGAWRSVRYDLIQLVLGRGTGSGRILAVAGLLVLATAGGVGTWFAVADKLDNAHPAAAPADSPDPSMSGVADPATLDPAGPTTKPPSPKVKAKKSPATNPWPWDDNQYPQPAPAPTKGHTTGPPTSPPPTSASPSPSESQTPTAPPSTTSPPPPPTGTETETP